MLLMLQPWLNENRFIVKRNYIRTISNRATFPNHFLFDLRANEFWIRTIFLPPPETAINKFKSDDIIKKILFVTHFINGYNPPK